MVNVEIKGLPKAKEMLELQWDNSLEEEAQRYYYKSQIYINFYCNYTLYQISINVGKLLCFWLFLLFKFTTLFNFNAIHVREENSQILKINLQIT